MRNYTIILLLIIFFSSCKGNEEESTNDLNETTSSNIEVDHLNIWVNDPNIAKERLKRIGFTSVPDSLSAVHDGQGTAGKYFNFLNGYLELIFVYDKDELEDNIKKNRNLDFRERANFEFNGALPFSIALKMKNYNPEKIPFEKVKYHQDWMDVNANIYAARNSKELLQEPSIFIVYPEIESDRFETMSELSIIPDEYAFARDFYKHPNGAKKITNIIITSTDLDLKTKTLKAVNGITYLTVKNGEEHLMELYFDNHIQEKTFDLRPELPLIINL